MESLVANILGFVGLYLVIGVIFSIIFIWKGLKKVDPATVGSSFFFKALIFPAMTALWVFFLIKWVRK